MTGVRRDSVHDTSAPEKDERSVSSLEYYTVWNFVISLREELE
jgi:hypothetical protein